MATPIPALKVPQLQLSGEKTIIDLIEQNGDFTSDIPLGKLAATLTGQESWTLPAPKGSVTLAIGGKAFADLGVYSNPKMLINDLGFSNDSGAALSFNIAEVDGTRYTVFRCGYNASGSVSGSMALSPYGSVNFGLDGQTSRMFAFVRRASTKMKSNDALDDLRLHLLSPAAVNQLLPQGTWIISECDGQISGTLGVQAGYTLNWVRSLNLRGLSGDVGLKIAAGASLTLGALLAGKFYLVLSCDDDPSVVRYRLFRSTTKGWNFALNAGVDLTPSTGQLLPEHIDDLLKGIFGIHDTQLLLYLQAANITDLTNDGLNSLIKALDPSGDVQKGLTRLQSLFDKWQTMPQDVTTLVWKHASDSTVLTKLASAATQLANANAQTIQNVLSKLLAGTSISSDPVAQWLEGAASQDLFSLFEDAAAGAQIRISAKQLLGVLDGADVQDVLQKLKTKVDAMLDLPTLESSLKNGQLGSVALWVQRRLAQLLGIDVSGLSADLDKINKIIEQVRSKADQLYSAALKALNATYSFSLNYAYAASGTRTALIDAEFDAAAIGRGLLQQAVAGSFANILDPQTGGEDVSGIRLNAATLTHSIHREGKLAVHIPHYVSTADHILSGVSQDHIADSAGGRIDLFQASAQDQYLENANNNVQRYASLSLGISGVATAVRKFDIQSVDFGYEMRSLQRAMSRSEFQTQFGPIVQQYFPAQFGDASSNSQHAAFNSWVIDWDKYTDAYPGQTPAGDGIIGDVWSETQLRMSNGDNVTWVDALLEPNVQLNLRAMAVAMQQTYRGLVLKSYMSDPVNLANVSGPVIDAFLCWVSLPLGQLDTRPEVLAGNITSNTAVSNLCTTRGVVATMLQGIPSLRKYAQFWDPRPNVASNWLSALSEDMGRVQQVISFLMHEQEMIDTAIEGFKGLQKAGSNRLDDALDAMIAAGLNLTSAFNTKMGSLFDRAHVIRYFGPLMFQSAIQALFPDKAPRQTDVRFNVAVLKQGQFPTTDDPSFQPNSKQVLLQQVLINFA